MGGVGGQDQAQASVLPGKRSSTHWIGGWVGPRPVWRGAENLARTGIRSPNRPASSESLYRLRNLVPQIVGTHIFIVHILSLY